MIRAVVRADLSDCLEDGRRLGAAAVTRAFSVLAPLPPGLCVLIDIGGAAYVSEQLQCVLAEHLADAEHVQVEGENFPAVQAIQAGLLRARDG